MDILDQFINKSAQKAKICEEMIEEMLNNPERYNFAEPFLISIYDQIQERGEVSDKQYQAVENVYNSGNQWHHRSKRRKK